MFTMPFYLGLRPRPDPDRTVAGSPDWPGGTLRIIALLGVVLLGLPRASFAQGTGTLQVAARVVPALVSWAGVAEAGVAARGTGLQVGRVSVRRSGLVHARAEIHPSGGRPLLVVTIQHPHN